jgi:hypothetical protein
MHIYLDILIKDIKIIELLYVKKNNVEKHSKEILILDDILFLIHIKNYINALCALWHSAISIILIDT